jgi:hypothetical protein
VSLELSTAGESHGPALVAIVTGLPAGLVLDREAIDADLRRRQEGYGRSPRQRIEQDRVEVLAGLRHGRTLGTPLALVVRNRDHENWAWGMSPWPPGGEPAGKGTKPVTLPRPGHADLAGTWKFGLADARDALERASARHTAVAVAAGAIDGSGVRALREMGPLARGVLRGEGFRIDSSDPLGMFASAESLPPAEIAIVLPRFTELTQRQQLREVESSLAAPRAGAGTEVYGVREYRPGDPRRRIHWRLSARRGELIVREYEPPGERSLVIAVDPAPPTPAHADQVARLAASEAWDCLRTGGRAVLWAPGLAASADERSLWPLLEWLARYPALPSEDSRPPLGAEAVAITAGSTDVLEAVEAVRRRGGEARAWVVGEADIDAGVPARAAGLEWPLQ